MGNFLVFDIRGTLSAFHFLVPARHQLSRDHAAHREISCGQWLGDCRILSVHAPSSRPSCAPALPVAQTPTGAMVWDWDSSSMAAQSERGEGLTGWQRQVQKRLVCYSTS